ncbi:hypothetical protein [Limosilactobacillus fermentum]
MCHEYYGKRRDDECILSNQHKPA